MAITPAFLLLTDSGASLSNENLTISGHTNSASSKASAAVTTGKYYFEVTLPSGQEPGLAFGLKQAAVSNGEIGICTDNGGRYGFGNWDGSAPGNFTTTDQTAGGVFGIFVDADAGTMGYVTPAGVKVPVALTGAVAPLTPFFFQSSAYWVYARTTPATYTLNFGATAFTHAVPSGYTAGFGVVSGANHADLAAPAARVVGYGGASAELTAPAARAAGLGGGFAALGMPGPRTFAAGHDSAGENASYLTLPRPDLRAFGGANAQLTGPRPTLAIAGKVTNWGSAALAAPAATLDGVGTVSALGSADLTLHNLFTLTGYSGAVCAVTIGACTLLAAGTTGSIGRAALTLPLFTLTAEGTARNHGTASLLSPSPRLGATAQAWLMAPGAQLTAIGSAVVAVSYEAYSINLSHTPKRGVEPTDEVTRYTNFPFTRIVRYRNSYFGVAADGLYLLEGTLDDGAAIPYAVKTCIDDFKTPELKTVASAYFGGRLGPDATVTLHAGEQGQESYAYTTPRGQGAQNHREKFGRGVKNRYFAIGVTGEGALELDMLELEINKLPRRI